MASGRARAGCGSADRSPGARQHVRPPRRALRNARRRARRRGARRGGPRRSVARPAGRRSLAAGRAATPPHRSVARAPDGAAHRGRHRACLGRRIRRGARRTRRIASARPARSGRSAGRCDRQDRLRQTAKRPTVRLPAGARARARVAGRFGQQGVGGSPARTRPALALARRVRGAHGPGQAAAEARA